MQKGKVKIADGYPETLSNLKIFQEKSKKNHPDIRLKTLAEAIDFAIEEAEKVPALTQENEQLKKRITELEEKE